MILQYNSISNLGSKCSEHAPSERQKNSPHRCSNHFYRFGYVTETMRRQYQYGSFNIAFEFTRGLSVHFLNPFCRKKKVVWITKQ